MSTPAIETETVVLLPLAECHKSPSQPRRRNDGKPDADFVASIKQKGVIQPIVVRVRKAGGWEVVFGHRRHTGSLLAGRDKIPAIIRDMTDDDVFEAQLIENVHRSDMHPLDEADGFKRMIDHGRTAAQVAEKIGRPVTYVVQRLKLCELGKECRAALDNDKISLGTAVLIARIPPSLQAEALRSIQGWWTAAQTKRELDVLFLLRLDQAPFDISNAELVPKAGACTACPKRTGQQRELFPDAVRADLCTDRVCYRGKLDAVWKIRVKEAKAGGTAVIEGKAAQKAFGYGSGYTRLDGEEYFGGKYQKVRAVFGKTLPPITLARDDKSGGIVELVRSADVAKLTKERASTNDYNARTGMSKREEQRIKLRAAAVDMAIAWAVERTSRLDGGQLVRLITHAMIERAWDEVQKTVIRRRGLEEAKGKTKRVNSTTAERLLLTYLKTLTKPADVAGLALEVALREVAPGKWKTPTPIWGDTLKALGIKFEDIEKTVAAEAKAKKKAKEKKPKKTPRAPKVRTCSKCGCTDEAACPGGCAWASRNPDICSSCV